MHSRNLDSDRSIEKEWTQIILLSQYFEEFLTNFEIFLVYPSPQLKLFHPSAPQGEVLNISLEIWVGWGDGLKGVGVGKGGGEGWGDKNQLGSQFSSLLQIFLKYTYLDLTIQYLLS